MTALAEAVLDAFDDDALAQLADRLRPYLVASDPHALLTPAAAAERLGLHPKTLVRAAGSGRVPGARRVGTGWRFDPATLDVLPVQQVSPTKNPRVPSKKPVAPTRAVDAIRGTGGAS